ncbi:MAG: hypothetical protein ACPG31_01820 [Planctomycetota bacterium]
MRLIATLTLLLGAANSVAAQETHLGIPVEKTGPEAQAAYDAWLPETATNWEYPAQVHLEAHMEMEMGMDMGEEVENMHVEIGFMFEVLHDSPEEMRSWGNGMVIVDGLGFDLNWTFEFQLESKAEGARMSFKDNRALSQEMNFHLPSAYTLSADRVEKAVKGIHELTYSSLDSLSVNPFPPLEEEHGVFGMYHPAVITRLIATYPTSRVVGWGSKDGQVLVQTKPDFSILDQSEIDAAGEAGQAVLDALADVTYTISLEEKTGSMVAYGVEESIPMDAFFPAEGGLTGKLTMMMAMKRVPVSADAPVVTFPEDETVLDCNVPFDKYWGMLEMVIELQEAQLEAAEDQAESDEDFDF